MFLGLIATIPLCLRCFWTRRTILFGCFSDNLDRNFMIGSDFSCVPSEKTIIATILVSFSGLVFGFVSFSPGSSGWTFGCQQIPRPNRPRPVGHVFYLVMARMGQLPAVKGWLAHTALPNRHRPFVRVLSAGWAGLWPCSFGIGWLVPSSHPDRCVYHLRADVCTASSWFMCPFGMVGCSCVRVLSRLVTTTWLLGGVPKS